MSDEPIQFTTGGGAEAWGYLSRSGKTLEVIVRPLDVSGDPILDSPVHVKIPLRKLERRDQGTRRA